MAFYLQALEKHKDKQESDNKIFKKKQEIANL